MMRSGSCYKSTRSVLLHAFLTVVTAVFLLPIIWIVLTSFKTKLQAFPIPAVWIFRPTLENYVQVFTYLPFFTFLSNSLVVATGSTLLSMLVGVMAAYGLTRFRF